LDDNKRLIALAVWLDALILQHRDDYGEEESEFIDGVEIGKDPTRPNEITLTMGDETRVTVSVTRSKDGFP
jgi:hypothetical protein